MGDGFNSVFSYLKAENGKYKLIKPFTPYAGLVKFTLGKLEEPYYQNLFYRMMSFMPNQYCFELDTTGFNGEVESSYYPETYKAKKYVDYSVEFHTDDYKVYSVIDLEQTSSANSELCIPFRALWRLPAVWDRACKFCIWITTIS